MLPEALQIVFDLSRLNAPFQVVVAHFRPGKRTDRQLNTPCWTLLQARQALLNSLLKEACQTEPEFARLGLCPAVNIVLDA